MKPLRIKYSGPGSEDLVSFAKSKARVYSDLFAGTGIEDVWSKRVDVPWGGLITFRSSPEHINIDIVRPMGVAQDVQAREEEFEEAELIEAPEFEEEEAEEAPEVEQEEAEEVLVIEGEEGEEKVGGAIRHRTRTPSGRNNYLCLDYYTDYEQPFPSGYFVMALNDEEHTMEMFFQVVPYSFSVSTGHSYNWWDANGDDLIGTGWRTESVDQSGCLADYIFDLDNRVELGAGVQNSGNNGFLPGYSEEGGVFGIREYCPFGDSQFNYTFNSKSPIQAYLEAQGASIDPGDLSPAGLERITNTAPLLGSSRQRQVYEGIAVQDITVQYSPESSSPTTTVNSFYISSGRYQFWGKETVRETVFGERWRIAGNYAVVAEIPFILMWDPTGDFYYLWTGDTVFPWESKTQVTSGSGYTYYVADYDRRSLAPDYNGKVLRMRGGQKYAQISSISVMKDTIIYF